MTYCGTKLHNQSGADERFLTGSLLSRLSRHVAIEHRPTRDVEEKVWGADLALMLHAEVHK